MTRLEIVSRGAAAALGLPAGSAAVIAANVLAHVLAESGAEGVAALLQGVPRRLARRYVRDMAGDREGALDFVSDGSPALRRQLEAELAEIAHKTARKD